MDWPVGRLCHELPERDWPRPAGPWTYTNSAGRESRAVCLSERAAAAVAPHAARRRPAGGSSGGERTHVRSREPRGAHTRNAHTPERSARDEERRAPPRAVEGARPSARHFVCIRRRASALRRAFRGSGTRCGPLCMWTEFEANEDLFFLLKNEIFLLIFGT